LFINSWWNTGEGADKGFEIMVEERAVSIQTVAYVDDSNKYVAAKISESTSTDFFKQIKKICERAAMFSLVFKIGRNAKKCAVTTYNTMEGTPGTPNEIESIAWSYNSNGPIKSKIQCTHAQMNKDGKFIKYIPDGKDTDNKLLAIKKFLGAFKNAYGECGKGVEKILTNTKQRIDMVWRRANALTEIRLMHNMIVLGVAVYNVLSNPITLDQSMEVDKRILSSYMNKMGFYKF